MFVFYSMSMPGAPALKFIDTTKSYGPKEVVSKLNLEIKQGEIFGLLGPNGAGKSTTINMSTGLTRISGGKIEVFGADNQKQFNVTRQDIGVMHQEIIVDNFFTLEMALKIHPGYYGFPDDPEWRELVITRMALDEQRHKKMSQLSGGMKRRMMMAKALIHKPRLLILDEPTAGVDVELRKTIWSFVRELNKAGMTIVLTTHYLEEAAEMCDRIGFMNKGQLISLKKRDEISDLEDLYLATCAKEQSK